VRIDLETLALTLVALAAFASNSLLARFALGAGEIDAATFTFLRLASGAAVLALVVRARRGLDAPPPTTRRRSIVGPLALFAYAAPFSFAYLRIGAAVGALVLFGVVQLTMIGWGIRRGERPGLVAWLGLGLALAGLVVLTAPSTFRPDPLGLALMAVAGVAWGVYSLAGRANPDPVAANAWSFLGASALALPLVLWLRDSGAANGRGVSLALVSGGLTSGLGYVIWYRALPRLTVTQAAVAQVGVPVIAAVGAALLLHEALSLRFLVSAVAILGGVGLVFVARTRPGSGGLGNSRG
jgi:drug/metabolite transporter (DMT)-like permease